MFSLILVVFSAVIFGGPCCVCLSVCLSYDDSFPRYPLSKGSKYSTR